MARWDKFAEGMSGGIGQGLQLGKQVKGNVEEKRNKAIDAEIGQIMKENPEVQADPSLNREGLDQWQQETDANPNELKELPMSVRYAIDGDSQIKRVQDLLYDRHGGFTPDYVKANDAFIGQMQDLQQDLLMQAKANLTAGDKDAAAEALTRAYSMFPDGRGVEITERDGQLYGIGFDMKNMKADGSLAITPEAIDMAAMDMRNPDTWKAYLLDKAADDRARSKNQRDQEMHDDERSLFETRKKMLMNEAAMSDLELQLAEDDGSGKFAQQRARYEHLQQETETLNAQAFKYRMTAWAAALDRDAKGNVPRPKGMSGSDYNTHIDSMMGDMCARVKDRTSGEIGMVRDNYKGLYRQHGDAILREIERISTAAITRGLRLEPERIIEKAEDVVFAKQNARRTPVQGTGGQMSRAN